MEIQPTLLGQNGRSFSCMICGNIGKLLEFLGANLAEVSEKKDERKLNSARNVSEVFK